MVQKGCDAFFNIRARRYIHTNACIHMHSTAITVLVSTSYGSTLPTFVSILALRLYFQSYTAVSTPSDIMTGGGTKTGE